MKLPGENILSRLNDRIVLNRHIFPFTRRNENRNNSKENTLCLFCHPRGGSTWLAEILMNIQGSVLIDEPLWRGVQQNLWQKPDTLSGKVSRLADLGFFYHQHIPEAKTWPEAEVILREILAGRIPSKSLYDEQKLSRLGNQGIYITKFCYANLLMPWLLKQFDFNSILLTRHPCAVVSSQLKHPSWQHMKIDINTDMDFFPFNDFYKSAISKIGHIESVEMYMAMIWVLGFRETAMHADNNQRWLTISYESLALNFKSEINRINHRFGFGLIAEEIENDKPSKSTRIESGKKLISKDQLDSWKNELSKKQIDDIMKVLDIFEIDVYDFRSEPDYSRLYHNEFFS